MWKSARCCGVLSWSCKNPVNLIRENGTRRGLCWIHVWRQQLRSMRGVPGAQLKRTCFLGRPAGGGESRRMEPGPGEGVEEPGPGPGPGTGPRPGVEEPGCPPDPPPCGGGRGGQLCCSTPSPAHGCAGGVQGWSAARRGGNPNCTADLGGRQQRRGAAGATSGVWQGLRRLVETTSSLLPIWSVKNSMARRRTA